MPRYYGNQAGEGLTLMLIGGLIGSPFLFYFGLFQYMTAPVYYYSAGLVATSGAAAAVGVSAATILGIGALVTYGAVGLGYLYFAAKDAYNGDKSLVDIIKSRVFNEDGWSFKGVMTSIGAILWSPFLLLGALAGMGVKATVQAYRLRNASSPRSSDASSNDEEYSSYNSAQEGMGVAPQADNGKKKTSGRETAGEEASHRGLFDSRKKTAPLPCCSVENQEESRQPGLQ